MRTAGIHHVDLVVSSIERSLPFYRELLAPLGFTRVGEVRGERGETIWYLGGPGSSVGLREAQSESGPVDRYAVGLHHLAVLARRSTSAPAGSATSAPRSRASRASTTTCPATTPCSFTTRTT